MTVTTNVRFCTCVHEGQDKMFGKRNRLHNLTKKEDWRCTVCGNIKTGTHSGKPPAMPVPEAAKKKEKK